MDMVTATVTAVIDRETEEIGDWSETWSMKLWMMKWKRFGEFRIDLKGEITGKEELVLRRRWLPRRVEWLKEGDGGRNFAEAKWTDWGRGQVLSRHRWTASGLHPLTPTHSVHPLSSTQLLSFYPKLRYRWVLSNLICICSTFFKLN